jgi:hypothetical protein
MTTNSTKCPFDAADIANKLMMAVLVEELAELRNELRKVKAENLLHRLSDEGREKKNKSTEASPTGCQSLEPTTSADLGA